MLKLPNEQPPVEALLKGDAGAVAFAGAGNLEQQQLINGLAVQGFRVGCRTVLGSLAERRVTDIFEQQKALFLAVVIQVWNPHAERPQKAINIHIRQLGQRLGNTDSSSDDSGRALSASTITTTLGGPPSRRRRRR